MKILVIGATGTLGAAAAEALSARHDIVRASRNGIVRIDIEDLRSILDGLRNTPDLDAVVCCAGRQPTRGLLEISDEEIDICVRSKLLGQINLARAAAAHLRAGGSITLTSGAFARFALPGTCSGAMVNAALEGFVRSGSLDLPRGLRINTVSPGPVKETFERQGSAPAHALPAAAIARAYVAAVEGTHQGSVLDPSEFQ